MMERTSVITDQLCDVLAAQAMQDLPVSPETMLGVCNLLRFIAADCAAMERRLAGLNVLEFNATNVVPLRRPKPAGDA